MGNKWCKMYCLKIFSMLIVNIWLRIYSFILLVQFSEFQNFEVVVYIVRFIIKAVLEFYDINTKMSQSQFVIDIFESCGKLLWYVFYMY